MQFYSFFLWSKRVKLWTLYPWSDSLTVHGKWVYILLGLNRTSEFDNRKWPRKRAIITKVYGKFDRTTHMVENQQEIESFWKCLEIQWKYTILIFLKRYENNIFRTWREHWMKKMTHFWMILEMKKYRLVVNIQSLMPYSITIHVRLREGNRTFSGRKQRPKCPSKDQHLNTSCGHASLHTNESHPIAFKSILRDFYEV